MPGSSYRGSAVGADIRKTLPQLKEEWEDCQRCDLGKRRLSKNPPTPIVWGTGKTNGIMFIGEGPGKEEETSGTPFVGVSGRFLRGVIKKLELTQVYITNVVSCRSCSPMLDGSGNVITGYGGLPRMKDEAPLPVQMEACLPRLLEEIYLVDPVVIVTLGGKAAELLLQRPVTITMSRGEEAVIQIPGAAKLPQRTDKKREWIRRGPEGLHAPTVQNEVSYLVIPTLHPAYVLRSKGDLSPNGSPKLFFSDIKKAKAIYERYQRDVHGVIPGEVAVDEEVELLKTLQEGDDDEHDHRFGS